MQFTVSEARRQDDLDFSISEADLLSFFGLCIARGLLHGKNEPVHNLWSKEFGRDVFRNTMSRDRFLAILRYIRFDDKTTRSQRRATDKFAAIRDLWESVITKCGDCFNPGESTTVDEQLFPCKCRCPFIQFMANKPDKFGIKFWLICDVRTKYVLKAVPYLGKDETRPSSSPVGESVVMNMTEKYNGFGISVTTDNFFTSVQLAEKLLKKKITLLGTMKHCRREVPKQAIKQLLAKNVPVKTAKFYRKGQCLLTIYKAKRNRVVLLLSTQHRCASISEASQLPVPVYDYNQSKYGVDTADQMLRLYSCKAATRRWPLSVFFNLLDIIVLNASVIARDLQFPRSRNRREFIITLIASLCRTGQSGHASTIQQTAALGCSNQSNQKRVRCHICKTNKTKINCQKCKIFVCGSCSQQVCRNCM